MRRCYLDLEEMFGKRSRKQKPEDIIWDVRGRGKDDFKGEEQIKLKGVSTKTLEELVKKYKG